MLAAGLAAVEGGSCGKDVTPFLLDYFHRETGGASLEANVRLVLRNAELAAPDRGGPGGVSSAIVLGDVMVDVVARLAGPVAVGSDSEA